MVTAGQDLPATDRHQFFAGLYFKDEHMGRDNRQPGGYNLLD